MGFHRFHERWRPLVGRLVFAAAACTFETAVRAEGPLAPEAALQTFQLADELRLELVASEPMVRDPVAIAWDARGRMFVAEMADYPVGPVQGRIRLLEDRDGDGAVDMATTFAEGLAFPNSVLPYRDGVLVSAAPDILWLRDTDGDGAADERRVLLTGFAEGNQQLRVNGLLWGLDNWLYGANGRSDGAVRVVDADGRPGDDAIPLRAHDFRFDVRTGRFERAGGFTQFGQGIDDFGERFISWNTVHIRHVVMEQRYLERNPRAPLSATAQEICVEGSTPRLYPLSSTTPRFNAEPPGFFNASCGLSVYLGDALPEAFRGNAFACEPLSNLVHRDLLSPQGATFAARRAPAETDREFLASSDRWFRPVNTATGPDGALYIVDFYRAWVEHPQFVADAAAREATDFAEGRDFGRIYRVAARDAARRPWPNLAELSTLELVERLAFENGWVRHTAQRLLVERQDAAAVAPLRAMLIEHSDPRARVHALHALDGLGRLDAASLGPALRDLSPRVRARAVLAAESRLAGPTPNPTDELLAGVLACAEDEDAAVRFRAALALGESDDPRILRTLAQLAFRDGDEPWMRRAISSALRTGVVDFVGARRALAMATGRRLSADERRWLSELIALDDSELSQWETLIAQAPGVRTWTWLVLAGVCEREQRASRLPALPESMQRNLEAAWAAAAEMAVDPAAEAADRTSAVQLLSFSPAAETVDVCERLAGPEHPPELQQAAVEALARLASPGASIALRARLPSAAPAARRAILDALFRRESSPEWLVESLEAGHVSSSDFDPTQIQVLLDRTGEPLKSRLAEKLSPPSAAERRRVAAEAWEQVRVCTGDAARGRALFVQNCGTCHAVQGQGARVGADLSSVAGRSPEDLVHDILDPNRAVSADYISFVVVTQQGQVAAGLLAGESAASITLRRAGGVEETFLRSDLAEFRTLGQSLMPAGFERTLQPQDLADVIAFLKSGQSPPAP